jgi:hypothetical membrane protein
MNFSFILLGLGQLFGAVLLYCSSPKRRTEQLAFLAMAVAGLGTALVGIFPENVQPQFHGIAAAMPLLIGNIGILLFGFSSWLPVWLRWYARIAGVVALVAIGLFAAKLDGVIGHGGMERFAAYPQTVWLILTGGWLLFQQYGAVRYNQKHHGRNKPHAT